MARAEYEGKARLSVAPARGSLGSVIRRESEIERLMVLCIQAKGFDIVDKKKSGAKQTPVKF